LNKITNKGFFLESLFSVAVNYLLSVLCSSFLFAFLLQVIMFQYRWCDEKYQIYLCKGICFNFTNHQMAISFFANFLQLDASKGKN